jgi:hypothetical protein
MTSTRITDGPTMRGTIAQPFSPTSHTDHANVPRKTTRKTYSAAARACHRNTDVISKPMPAMT